VTSSGPLVDIDHVGIAVADLDRAVEEYGAAFGVEPAHRERVEDQGVEEVLFAVGTSYIQLLAALGPDTPVGRFLARRGEGVHHVGYRRGRRGLGAEAAGRRRPAAGRSRPPAGVARHVGGFRPSFGVPRRAGRVGPGALNSGAGRGVVK